MEIELDYAEEGYLSMMGRNSERGQVSGRGRRSWRWMNLHFGIWIFRVRSAIRHLHSGWRNIYVVRNVSRANRLLLRSGCRYL